MLRELSQEAAIFDSVQSNRLGLTHTCMCSLLSSQVADVARSMELGREAADFVSEQFIRPVKLEFEKVSDSQHTP